MNTTLRTGILSLFFVLMLTTSGMGVSAQEFSNGTGISGDSYCGSSSSTKCTFNHLKGIGERLFILFAAVGSVALFIGIAYFLIFSVGAKYMLEGDVSALTRAKKQTFNMLVGFGVVLVVVTFLVTILQGFGVQAPFLKLLQLFSDASLVSHAYAAGSQLLPNPLSSNSAYDIIIAGANLAMRFFIYPVLVAIWVASGFKFVYSQGNPEGIKTAKNWILVAFISTIIIFSLQGFIVAFRNTAQRVFQGAGTGAAAPSQQVAPQATTQTGTADGRALPVAETAGSACTTKSGQYGTLGTDGSCKSRTAEPCYGQVGLDGNCYSGTR
jgi:hypothetical protein